MYMLNIISEENLMTIDSKLSHRNSRPSQPLGRKIRSAAFCTLSNLSRAFRAKMGKRKKIRFMAIICSNKLLQMLVGTTLAKLKDNSDSVEKERRHKLMELFMTFLSHRVRSCVYQ